MVEKMKLVSMFGNKEDMDCLLTKYVMNLDVQLENPLSVFKTASGFVPHTEVNPYEATLKRFAEVFDYAGVEYLSVRSHKGSFSKDQLSQYIESFDQQIHSLRKNIREIQDNIEKIQLLKDSLVPIIDADIHIEDLTKLKFMKFRFGHLPLENYNNLNKYLLNLPVYFTAVKIDKNDVWGFYFASSERAHQIDHLMATLYFQRIYIEGENFGTPREIVQNAEKKLVLLQEEIRLVSEKMNNIIKIQKEDLLDAYACVKFYYEMNKIKRFAAYTPNKFYLTFWADIGEVKKLKQISQGDSNVSFAFDEADLHQGIKVPTKLKNILIVRPFEEFVKMYGIPNYNEIDPTAFLAIFYSLLFGMMFGDVGHGIVLFCLGLFLTVLKKGGFLAKIAIPVGVSSTIFGIFYGTFFGYEGHRAIIKPLWFTPMEDKTRILLTTVALGVGILILCMILNIINGIKQKNWRKIFFSQNGVAGLLFYTLALYLGVSVFMGAKKPFFVAVIVIVLSLVLIFLQEPLGKMLKGVKKFMPTEKGSFFVQSFFELFEIVLSFVTNTMSFVRVGAFALNHAGMMSVVIMFMDSLNSSGSLFVAVLGNILVMGLEGLIVGIQVLRLGFYEMFSRFYEGDGRAFDGLKN